MSRWGMDLARQRAEDQFRTLLQEAGTSARTLVLDRIDSETDLTTHRLMFAARFVDMVTDNVHRVQWHLDDWEVENFPTNARGGVHWVHGEFRTIWHHLLEDHLLELELRPRREAVRELERLAVVPAILQRAWEDYRQFESHLHRNHAYARDVRGSMREISPRGYAHLNLPPLVPRRLLRESIRQQTLRMREVNDHRLEGLSRSMRETWEMYAAQVFNGYLHSGEVGNEKAQA